MRLTAALRHRAGQAVSLAVLSALVTACAVVAPLTTRSIEEGLLRSHLGGSGPDSGSATSLVVGRRPGSLTVPDQLLPQVGPHLREVHAPPIGSLRASTHVETRSGAQPSPAVLRSRTELCRHVTVSGRCPARAGEVLVSAADARAWDWRAGTRLSAEEHTVDDTGRETERPRRLTVVGSYEAPSDEGYWLGGRPDGKSGVPMSNGLDLVKGVDDLLTVEQTFEGHYPFASASLELPLKADRAELDDVTGIESDLARLRATPEARVEEVLGERLDVVRTAQDQVRVVVPVVAGQLGLVAVVVLLLVAQVAADSRRRDIALLRLRGRSRGGVRALVATELAVPVLLGVVPGLLLALLVDGLVRWRLLPPDLPRAIPWTVWPAVGMALVAAVVAILLAVRPVLAESIGSLLQPTAPRRASGVAADAVVLVLALAGVVGLATGTLTGGASLLTPTLLALAAGMVGARLLALAATRRTRGRASGRGTISRTLAAASIARRPGARRVLVVTTVATALAVSGASAVATADRNRLERAELEVGAPATLSTTATSISDLRAVAADLRDSGTSATPVVVAHPADPTADATIAVDAETLGSVTAVDLDLAPYTVPAQESVLVDGERLAGTGEWRPEPGSGDLELRMVLTEPDGGETIRRVLSTDDRRGDRPTALDVDLTCAGCRVAGLQVHPASPGEQVRGELVLADLAVDGEPLPLAEGGALEPAQEREADDGAIPSGDGSTLRLDVVTTDDEVGVVMTDVPQPIPALVSTGAKNASRTDPFSLTTVGGGQATVRSTGTVEALPAVTDRGVLVSLPTLARLGDAVDLDRASPQLWLGDASPATLERARQALADRDIRVTDESTTREAKGELDRSASAWGLSLALVAGVAVLLLAALVVLLAAATARRVVARDLAALLVSGVPVRSLRSALLREQLVVVGLGVVLGSVTGVVGGWLAMSGIPLFDAPASVPSPDLAPSWAAALAAATASLLLLGATAFVTVRRTASQVRPEALREAG